jgi:hypothetical protein
MREKKRECYRQTANRYRMSETALPRPCPPARLANEKGQQSDCIRNRSGFKRMKSGISAGMCKASARAGPLSSSGLRPSGHQGMPLWHFKNVSLLDS